VSATTFGYDNDGNRTASTTAGATTTYTYDQADRLLSIGGAAATPASYRYNGDGLRVAKTAGTVTTSYQWEPLSQTLLSDGGTEYVDNASGGLLVQTPTAGGASAAQYGVADALGSTRLLTDPSAQTQGTLAYDAFGVPKAPSGGSGTATTPLGFAGQLTDSESGFQNLRARLYDPTSGQFLQRDRFGGSAGSPATLNRYAYGGSDPTRFVDPSGNSFQSAFGCAAAIMQQIGAAVTGLTTFVGQMVANVVTFLTHLDYNALITAAATMIACTIPFVCGALYFAQGAIDIDLATGRHLSDQERQDYFKQAAIFWGLDVAAWGVGWVVGAWFKDAEELAAMERVVADDERAAEGTDQAAAQAARDAQDGVPHDAAGGDAAASDAAASDAAAGDAGGGAPCSFSPDTPVATPSGERPIGSLKVGDQVTAYDPATGKGEPETVQHVWINHDHDLVDVRVQTASPAAAGAAQTAPSAASRVTGAITAAVAVASLALVLATGHAVALPTDALASSPAATTAETIHTTANHPWLTADRGWVPAGNLRVGEALVRLDGSMAEPRVASCRSASAAHLLRHILAHGVPVAIRGQQDVLAVVGDGLHQHVLRGQADAPGVIEVQLLTKERQVGQREIAVNCAAQLPGGAGKARPRRRPPRLAEDGAHQQLLASRAREVRPLTRRVEHIPRAGEFDGALAIHVLRPGVELDLLPAWVDARVVIGRVVGCERRRHGDVHAAQRVHERTEASEVERHPVGDLQPGHIFDFARGQRGAGVAPGRQARVAVRQANLIGGVDLVVLAAIRRHLHPEVARDRDHGGGARGPVHAEDHQAVGEVGAVVLAPTVAQHQHVDPPTAQHEAGPRTERGLRGDRLPQHVRRTQRQPACHQRQGEQRQHRGAYPAPPRMAPGRRRGHRHAWRRRPERPRSAHRIPPPPCAPPSCAAPRRHAGRLPLPLRTRRAPRYTMIYCIA
jgi:RHS repeat-associated protein